MALALYRKYRPTTFAEVIGQEHVTGPLIQALRTGKLNHAYLFSGPRGCGKTSSARILARSLNCEQGPTPDPCGVCASCRALAADGPGSIDVIEIDAASHGGVDDARELREKAFFAPVSSRFKVYVIDEAHMVSSAGFNALLKLVEEPPEYVKFVFATTEPEKVLGTIRSRTHHYPFRLVPPSALRPFLERLCEREGARVESAVLPLIIRAGGGSVRDTLSLLDQLIAGAGSEGVEYSQAVALLGVTDATLIDEMCDALAAGDGASAYATIGHVSDAGHDPRRFVADLLDRLRDLIVLRQVPDAVATGLLDYPAEQLERMTAQAERIGPATLSRMADLVHAGLVQMRGTTAPRLLLELICARMLLPGAEESIGALLQRIECMERRIGQDGVVPAPAPAVAPARVPASAPSPAAPVASLPAAPAAPASAPAPAVPGTFQAAASVPAAPAPAPAREVDVATVRGMWDRVLAAVGDRSKRAAAVLREASVREVEGETLVVLFRHSVHADMLKNSPDVLLQALAQILGGRWAVRCELAGAPTTPGSAGAAAGSGAGSAGSGQPAAQTRPVGHAAGGNGAIGGGQRSSLQAPSKQPHQRSSQPAGDDGWPTPAMPGGGAASSGGTDWPDPAVPGGDQAAQGAAEGAAGGAEPARQAPRSPESSHQRPGRAGKGRPEHRSRRPGGQGEAARPAEGRPAWDGPAQEPPFDPDYDAAPDHDAAAYPGFDPGDEPVDDEQAAGPRESGADQAVRLLTEVFGAERIDSST